MTEAPQSRTDTEPTALMTVEPTPAARAQQAAAEAAGTIEGVHELGTPGGRALVRAMGRVPGGRTTYGPGVSVEVGQGRAALDVALVAEYGTPVPALAEKVRDAVRERVQREAELEVVEVNVTVLDVHHPDDDIAAAQRAETAARARARAQDAVGRARDVAQDAAERAHGVAQAADAVRDTDDAVQRIAAQAAEAAAEQEAAADGDQPVRVPGTNSTRNDRAVPSVVLDGADDGDGPQVVVADQVVIADRVVVADDQDGEQQDQQEKDRTS